MRKVKLFFKAPKSFVVRLYKLSKIFGFWESIKSLSKLFKKPLNPKSVVVSAYSAYIDKKIYFRPATSDVGILEQVFIEEDYNYNFNFKPGLLIDGGAHCGFASLYFLQEFPDMDVIAIEPEPSNFAILKKNLENIDSVTLINKPIMAKTENATLINPDAKSPSFQYQTSDEDSALEAATIEGMLEKYAKNFNNGILKLDIEGAEKEIFSHDPERWMGKFELIFVEPHDWIYPNTEEVIISAAQKNGKEVSRVGENIVLSKR